MPTPCRRPDGTPSGVLAAGVPAPAAGAAGRLQPFSPPPCTRACTRRQSTRPHAHHPPVDRAHRSTSSPCAASLRARSLSSRHAASSAGCGEGRAAAAGGTRQSYGCGRPHVRFAPRTSSPCSRGRSSTRCSGGGMHFASCARCGQCVAGGRRRRSILQRSPSGWPEWAGNRRWRAQTPSARRRSASGPSISCQWPVAAAAVLERCSVS